MTAAMQQVSQSYLIGIREARAMLQRFAADGMPIDSELAKRELVNVKECLAMGFSGDAREALRGERDFWARQCVRLAGGKV